MVVEMMQNPHGEDEVEIAPHLCGILHSHLEELASVPVRRARLRDVPGVEIVADVGDVLGKVVEDGAGAAADVEDPGALRRADELLHQASTRGIAAELPLQQLVEKARLQQAVHTAGAVNWRSRSCRAENRWHRG